MKISLIKFLFSMLVIITPIKGFSQDLQSVDFNLPGTIHSYLFEDLNNDGKVDIIISYTTFVNNRPVNRYLAIFFQSASGFYSNANQTLSMDLDIVGFDVGNVQGDDAKEILYVTKTGVYFIPLQKDLFRKEQSKLLFETGSIYSTPDPSGLARLKIAYRISNSALDDFLIPDGNSIHYFSYSGKRYTEQNELSAPITAEFHLTNQSTEAIQSIYSPKIYVINYALDNLFYICVESRGQLAVYNLADRSFILMPIMSTFYSSSALKEKVTILKVEDLNSDGIPDVLVEKFNTTDLIEKNVKYEFYFGQRDSKGVWQLKNSPDQTILAKGMFVQYSISDINNDGQMDMTIMEAQVSVGSIFTNILNNGIKVAYKLYLQKNSKFSNVPNYQKDVDQNIELRKDYDRKFPFEFSGDIDGDGLNDLIIAKDNQNLVVYLGNAKTYLASSRSIQQSVTIPNSGESLQLHHVFSTRKKDLVLMYHSQDQNNLRSTLKVLTR